MATHDPHHDPDPQLPPSFKESEVFRTPEGYFEDFASRLRLRLAGEDMPDPELTGLETREQPFTTPPDYFEQLPERVQARLAAEEPAAPEAPVRPLWSRVPGYTLRIAAAVAVLLVGGWLLLRYARPAAPSLADIPTESLLAAIEAEDLPADLILEVLDADDLSQLRPSAVPEEMIDELLDEVDLETLEAEWLETYPL